MLEHKNGKQKMGVFFYVRFWAKPSFGRAHFLGMACYFAINELISVTAAQPNFQVYSTWRCISVIDSYSMV